MRKIRHLIRATLPALFDFLSVLSLVQVLLIAGCAAMTPAQTQQAPEGQFIQGLGNKANGIFVHTSLTPAQLDAEYNRMLGDSFDIDAINEFVIGRTWQQATPAQQQDYTRLFKRLVLQDYGGHFRFHTGEGFHLNDVRQQSDVDTVVETEITHLDGTLPTPVDWIVRRKKDGKLAIVDVIVDGISQNTAQRNEFATILAQNGGDFNSLLNAMRRKVQ